MKIDLRKAYDSLSWEFIREVLVSLNFPQKFIHWLMLCITTARYSVVLNGNAVGYFKGGRGIRQGDPVSPYVFVLCMEVLSRMLKTATTDCRFRFHANCKEVKLNHLLFADDLMMFSYAARYSPAWLRGKLDQFSAMSGLQVNNSKSQVFLSNVPFEIQSFLMNSLGFQLGKLPVKYLGVPMISSRLSISDCMPILEKIKQRIATWTNKLLSFAGRALLIQSVLFHLQVYWSSMFILPKHVVDSIEQLCRNFLWTGNYEKQGVAPVAWQDVCAPRDEGGLGFKQVRELGIMQQ